MLPEKRTKTNVGVGIGVLLQLAGLFLAKTGDTIAILGLVLILVSIPVFIWGCMNYAEGKGHSMWVGLLGLAGVIGLIVLIVLPDQDLDGSSHRPQRRKLLGLILISPGLVLVVFGRWIDYLGDDFRLERLLYPWPGICIFFGVCLVIGSLFLMLSDGNR